MLEGVGDVAEHAVEDAALAVALDPGHGEVPVGAVERLHAGGGGVADVEAHQHPAVGAAVGVGQLVELVVHLEVLAAPGAQQRVVGLLQLHRPGAAGVPGVAAEGGAHDLGALRASP